MTAIEKVDGPLRVGPGSSGRGRRGCAALELRSSAIGHERPFGCRPVSRPGVSYALAQWPVCGERNTGGTASIRPVTAVRHCRLHRRQCRLPPSRKRAESESISRDDQKLI